MSRRICSALLVAAFALSLSTAVKAVAQGKCAAERIGYLSDGLKITGALMKPGGTGPFPVVIYNHGARTGREKQPQLLVGTPCLDFVKERRWVYLVPDRRGFGRSDGPSLPAVRTAAEAQSLTEAQLVAAFRARIRQEANDVVSGMEFLRALPFADLKRVGMIGYSLGGIVTLRVASGAPGALRVVVLQAAGAAETDRFFHLQLREMVEMARLVDAPILIQNGRDDTDSSVRFVRQFAEELRRVGKNVTVRIYPGTHDLFATYPRGPEGDWGRDLVAFLTRHLSR